MLLHTYISNNYNAQNIHSYRYYFAISSLHDETRRNDGNTATFTVARNNVRFTNATKTWDSKTGITWDDTFLSKMHLDIFRRRGTINYAKKVKLLSYLAY